MSMLVCRYVVLCLTGSWSSQLLSGKYQASTMTYLYGALLVWVLLIPAAVSSLTLTSYPDVATQGERFILSCDPVQEILKATWIVNSDPVFITMADTQAPVVNRFAQSFFNVSGRITVSTSYKQHNVSLRINSTLDDGSVWFCGQGGSYSNNITIHVIQHTTVVSTSQTTTLQTVQTSTLAENSVDTTQDVTHLSSQPTLKRPNEKYGPNHIPLIAGIVAGTVIVVSVVIVTALCVRRHRNIRKQADTTTPEIPVYSTMSRDYDTDNHYTQLDPRLNQSGNEATIDTPTDVYYNTVSKERDSYENPPLHHSVKQKIK